MQDTGHLFGVMHLDNIAIVYRVLKVGVIAQSLRLLENIFYQVDVLDVFLVPTFDGEVQLLDVGAFLSHLVREAYHGDDRVEQLGVDFLANCLFCTLSIFLVRRLVLQTRPCFEGRSA